MLVARAISLFPWENILVDAPVTIIKLRIKLIELSSNELTFVQIPSGLTHGKPALQSLGLMLHPKLCLRAW